jgi:hypothetical protein
VLFACREQPSPPDAAEASWAAYHAHKALVYNLTPFPHNRYHEKPAATF